ncbi:LptF/LptG family permease [Flavobacterium enshiense]|uniref:LptF/LptG family permease n=1 Tax=Flavobacterium enshiense TaxID=1341165 RepID=UPI001FCB73AA|nr:LptF/LptG family permease [Flavobacterium enshiense]UOK41518.1 LptF/LptG family permease [Flavobacterium enshiense]
MKILDRYILKSFLTTFTSVFVILFFIFILQGIWLFISELAGKNLDYMVVVKFLVFYSPKIVPLVLPLSILLASIMTFGSFAENYEFAAMKSAGISLGRAMKALTVFILLLSFAAFFFANTVIPKAEYKFINLRKDILQTKPAMAIAEGQFNTIGNSNIKVDKKAGENGELLEGVTMHIKSAQGFGNKTVIKAKRGVLKSEEGSNILKLDLIDGYYYEDVYPKKHEEQQRLPFAKATFKKYTINIDLTSLNKKETEGEIANTNTMLNVSELNFTIDSLQKNYKKDVISFTENISQGIEFTLRPKHYTSPGKFKSTDDVLASFTPYQRSQIFETALNNISSTDFSIQNNKNDLFEKKKNINKHWIALHDKFVVAFSCLLMFFIGAPLGAIIRKGGLGLPIVFAVLIFIIFHFINTFGKKVAQENGIPPFLGCWLSSMVLSPLAISLTYRATNDIGVMVNFDWITEPVQKLINRVLNNTEKTDLEDQRDEINEN